MPGFFPIDFRLESFLMTSQKVVKLDGTVKSFRCKAQESLPAACRLRNEAYIEVRLHNADEARRRRWTSYEAVISGT